MNTDPSGNCIFAGVDTVLCAVLGGAVIGGALGGAIGGAYAKWMYHLAYTGKCGCEGQQLIQQYTESQFFWKGVGMGAVFGAVFGALAPASIGGIAGSGAVLASLAGLGLSGVGIVNSIQRIQADPNNECAWWDLGLSVFGLVVSGYTLGKTISKIGLPGGGPVFRPRIPRLGEITDASRIRGKPPSFKYGIYEYWDKVAQKWYVGSSRQGIGLPNRLRVEMAQGRFTRWKEIVWTEIKGSPEEVLYAEQIRIEQFGLKNLANKKNAVNPDLLRNWIQQGGPDNVIDWPDWLYLP
jgi:hypothetical protein